MRPSAHRLLDTKAGRAWLQQFGPDDEPLARDLVTYLTLVSHSAFERALTRLIERAAHDFDGPVALYATREVGAEQCILQPSVQKAGKQARSIDAVSRGSDLGSEARVAAIIRNISRTNRKKYLNHPTIEVMRSRRCRAIFVVDDLVGSGMRTKGFLDSIWLSKSVRSWHSFGWIKLCSLSFSATSAGRKVVEKAACRPYLYVHRDCPTLTTIPMRAAALNALVSVCERWGQKTIRPGMSLGFKNTLATLVFEHGCPNNAPAILWADSAKDGTFQALFPGRSVLPAEASAFPPEIASPDHRKVLEGIGLQRLASSSALISSGPIGREILIILALVSRGVRTASALSYSANLEALECRSLLDHCMRRGFIKPELKITEAGRRELRYASGLDLGQGKKRLHELGDDAYYPHQLRGP